MKALPAIFLLPALSNRGAATFTLQAYLKAANSEAADFFGRPVAVSGNTVVVGATGESSNATGVNGNGANNAIFCNSFHGTEENQVTHHCHEPSAYL